MKGFAQILKTGLYTSIQDSGRLGFMHLGVPRSGWMDALSAQTANALLNNDENAACLEITLLGPSLRFSAPTIICIFGGTSEAILNGIEINESIIRIAAGDVLEITKLTKGHRAYLAIKGGWQSERILNSRSQYLTITQNASIKKDQVLNYNPFSEQVLSNTTLSFAPKSDIVFNKGPEYSILTASQIDFIQNTSWTVASYSNRMAYGFKESLGSLEGGNMLSSAVCPGIVQLTPSGHIYVLMRDAQTTGGYPRIAYLQENEISRLSQHSAGNKVHFQFK